MNQIPLMKDDKGNVIYMDLPKRIPKILITKKRFLGFPLSGRLIHAKSNKILTDFTPDSTSRSFANSKGI